jgi:hypothetical protein
MTPFLDAQGQPVLLGLSYPTYGLFQLIPNYFSSCANLFPSERMTR